MCVNYCGSVEQTVIFINVAPYTLISLWNIYPTLPLSICWSSSTSFVRLRGVVRATHSLRHFHTVT